MSKKPFILGINASPFPKGNTAKCLKEALAAGKETGADTKIIHLGQIPHDDGRRDEKNYDLRMRLQMLPGESNLHVVVQEILKADGIIFATPVRNFTASSRLHALMSWLQVTTDAPDYALMGKVAACMAICEEDGGQNACASLLNPLCHMGVIIPPFGTYFWNKFGRETEGGWAKTDRRLTGLNVRRMIQILRGEISPGNWNDDEIGSW